MTKKTDNKKRILIVEDEKPLAHALKLKLTKAGYEAEIVENGVEALEYVKSSDVDFIFTDLIMPGMDGHTFLKEFATLKKDIPVVVLSNLSQPEDVDKCKSEGAREYMIKADTSLDSISKYLDKYFSKNG